MLRFAPDQVAEPEPFGFWSITAYNPGFMLVENDHVRYSVQSSDPGLVRDDDGGFTLYTGPEPHEHRSNWVATKPGELFRLNYRVYLPTASMIASPDAVAQYLPPVMPEPGSSERS